MAANPATPAIQPADLGFFSTLASSGSLSAAARELGVTTPAVSKRLAQMEARVGIALVNRSTRRMSLTPEGELYLEHARRILGEIDGMAELLGLSRAVPQGLLRVNATLGFGRSHVAPLISRFARKHPRVEVQLQLSVNPPPLTDDAFDVCIRFGPPPDARVIARRIAPNRRLLCAAPAYLAAHGAPQIPEDLEKHNCFTYEYVTPRNVWRFRDASGAERAVRVAGTLHSNNGDLLAEVAARGAGITFEPAFIVGPEVRAGRLVPLLQDFTPPPVPIYAVYPSRKHLSAKVRRFVEFLIARYAQAQDWSSP